MIGDWRKKDKQVYTWERCSVTIHSKGTIDDATRRNAFYLKCQIKFRFFFKRLVDTSASNVNKAHFINNALTILNTTQFNTTYIIIKSKMEQLEKMRKNYRSIYSKSY